ncbi:MAG: 4-hydroxythreonine-4-phosphate dehydrogenase PdxA, partial [Deltaproteobacteria bacterium]|nr:4-hydroxythreonine-4-phosphate dehydrogenase PdxA [Deltaproteobacteria bacterium]
IRAARLALQGQAAAVVTGPINKESVQLAGYTEYIGNTEILEDICARHTGKKFAGKCLTMLISKQLRVAHVLRHVAFKDIVPRLTPEKLEQTIRLTVLGMMSLGFPQPRVAVAGLNPHNGDGGLMGDEEARLLTPMVDQLKGEGLNLTGPVPADSVFFRAIHGEFDAVVALYHDQGHIAVKTHGFEESISVSFGLPVIRTSVDHGTAFDLAGKGVASPTSLVESIKMACHIVKTGQWQTAP